MGRVALLSPLHYKFSQFAQVAIYLSQTPKITAVSSEDDIKLKFQGSILLRS